MVDHADLFRRYAQKAHGVAASGLGNGDQRVGALEDTIREKLVGADVCPRVHLRDETAREIGPKRARRPNLPNRGAMTTLAGARSKSTPMATSALVRQ